MLCGIFLVLVFINGGFKYYINTYKGQLGERMLRRFRYSLYLRLLRFPTTYFQKIVVGADHPDDHDRVRAARRLYRRRVRAAAVPGRPAADDHPVHVHAGSDARGGGGVALPAAGLRDPQAADQGQPARQAADPHDSAGRRPGAGIGRRPRRNPGQRHRQAAARRFRPHPRRDLRHPLRDLSAQILRQVPQQLDQPADAVLLLFDRRLPGDPRQPVVRRAGRGARRLQGSGVAVEGTARLLPEQRRTPGSPTTRSSSSSSRPA